MCLKELSLTPEQATMVGKETLGRSKHVNIEQQLQLSELETL